jgi:tetratricopeptide (TPR) repeat protein
MRELLLLGCLLSGAAFSQDDGGAVALVEPPADRLDALWKTRDEAATLKEIDEVVKSALKAGEDYGVLWRAARVRWWVADGASNEKLKKQIAKEGWLYADRALKLNGSGPEAKYYLALNIGAYSQAVGVLVAIGEGLEGKFVDNLDTACKANEAFDRMGCHTAKGRYWWELPWPKRDLKKSVAELEAVTQKHPEHLRTWLFLAETLLKDGKLPEAKAAFAKATAGSNEYDPPEARRIKGWAKALEPSFK